MLLVVNSLWWVTGFGICSMQCCSCWIPCINVCCCCVGVVVAGLIVLSIDLVVVALVVVVIALVVVVVVVCTTICKSGINFCMTILFVASFCFVVNPVCNS